MAPVLVGGSLVSFARSAARDRCTWLIAVPAGIPRMRLISSYGMECTVRSKRQILAVSSIERRAAWVRSSNADWSEENRPVWSRGSGSASVRAENEAARISGSAGLVRERVRLRSSFRATKRTICPIHAAKLVEASNSLSLLRAITEASWTQSSAVDRSERTAAAMVHRGIRASASNVPNSEGESVCAGVEALTERGVLLGMSDAGSCIAEPDVWRATGVGD